MDDVVHNAVLVILAVLLVVAAVGDARRFIIPNRLCLLIAALAVPWWMTSEASWLELGEQALFALLVFGLFAGVFALGWMGGGDVKLFAALALWLPWQPFLQMMMATAVIGGALTIGLVIVHRLRSRSGHPEIPYGVAISAGALMVIGQGIVNPFSG